MLFQSNPLIALEAFQKFNNNEMDVVISFFKAPDLDQALQSKIMDLMRTNMQTVYVFLLLNVLVRLHKLMSSVFTVMKKVNGDGRKKKKQRSYLTRMPVTS